MKTKFVRNGRTNRRELLVAAQRGETLHAKHAEKLADDPSALLLGFSHETQRGTGLAILHYDVEGLWSLRTYLSKRAMSEGELMGLMEATQGVLDLCAQRRLPAEGLIFDPEFVFVDAQCCPHFALVPLGDVPFQTRNSPLALLGAIGNPDRLRFANPDAMGLARRLGELVVDLDGVFSANRFRRFVEDEQRQAGGAPAPVREDEEPHTGSVWASAGATAEQDAPDDGSLFWSPLAGIAASEPEPDKGLGDNGLRPHCHPADGVGRREEDAPLLDTTPAVAPRAAAPAPQPAPQSAPAPQPAPAAPVQPGITLVRPVTGERFALPTGQQLRLGRGSACDIRLLGNRKLSRQHVALTSTGQMLMVTDLGAANGVFVDGQRVGQMQSILMTPGQRLRLADEDFEVHAS